MRRSRSRVAALPLTLLVLAGCGGGGGGGSSGPAQPLNTALAGLAVSAGTLSPSFAAATTTYAVGPSLLASSITVTATVADPTATLTVNGVATPSGTSSAPIALGLGLTMITVTVTATDATFSTTVLLVTRDGPIAQEAYGKASNTGAGDFFGVSVSLSGDTLAVGAILEDSAATGVGGDGSSNAAANAGAVYVFVRTGGTWAQQAYLKASNTGAGDQFGRSVSLSGDTLVVGAYLEDSAATGVNGDGTDNSSTDSGAAYVFVRSGTTWTQQAYLKAHNTGAGDQFGRSVALSGDTLLVGAPFEDSSAMGVGGDGSNNAATDAGAAYVFVRSGTVWTQQAYLKASNTGTLDQFGRAVALSADTAVVGAPFEDSAATGVGGNGADDSSADSGAAYVFVRSGVTWSQQAYLKALNTGAGDQFGLSVAVEGDTIVVGAPLEDSSATGIGGNGADDSAADSGAAYAFVRAGGVWSQQAYLKASNTGAGDQFGLSTAVAGDSLLVGAILEDASVAGIDGDGSDNLSPDAGAAYLFLRAGGAWSQQAYLKSSNPGPDDQFGFSVAISGDRLVVGSTREDAGATGINAPPDETATDAGAVYVFR